jgi:hypothetical protein
VWRDGYILSDSSSECSLVVAESLVLELETSSPIGISVSCLNICVSIVVDFQDRLAVDEAEDAKEPKDDRGEIPEEVSRRSHSITLTLECGQKKL